MGKLATCRHSRPSLCGRVRLRPSHAKRLGGSLALPGRPSPPIKSLALPAPRPSKVSSARPRSSGSVQRSEKEGGMDEVRYNQIREEGKLGKSFDKDRAVGR